MRKDSLIFSLTLVFIALHHLLEEVLGLEKNTLLLGIPFLVVGLIMIHDPAKGFHVFEKKVEWHTLVFFLLLFASVGAPEESGIISLFSSALISYAGASLEALMGIFTPLMVVMSASLDNVVAVTIFSRVVHSLEANGYYAALVISPAELCLCW